MTRAPGKRITEDIRSEVRKLRADGVTQREVAERFSIAENTVRNIEKEAPPPAVGAPPFAGSSVAEDAVVALLARDPDRTIRAVLAELDAEALARVVGAVAGES